MAYLLRRRNCYGPQEVANFRRQVIEEIVPVNNEIKRRQAKRIGVEDFQVYDNAYFFPDGNPLPHGTPDELMEAGRQMYTEMSPETAEFIQMMFDHDLFDVLSKEGKAMGGYCTGLPKYDAPFIFANWNGTAGDVDVLTHEAGHAFADYTALRCIPHLDLRDPTMEVCESHSMSMEFLTAPWHHLFFKEDTDKYELFHAESAMTFIPYGCQVDHFQESVYLHPEWTPAQRNEEWNRLEKLYRPHLDNHEVNFYNRGAGWQRQLHIYECPFYYIDYSLAQMISLQFWSLSMHDHKAAWEKYLDFAKLGRTPTFVDIVQDVYKRQVLGGVLVLCGVFDLLNIGYAILDSLDFLPAALLSGVLLSGAQAVMAVVSGIVFVRLGVSFLLERIANRSSITFIFPVIWALLACVEMFRDYPQIAGMPERTLYLLCLLCFTLFLMGHSRILGDVDFAKGTCWINAFGFCGALFGLTMTVGEVLCFSSMTLPLSDVLLVFALSLYCLAFSFNTYAER